MADLVFYGSASAPVFGGTVAASGALPAGRYLVTVTTLMSGTAATATDLNNMILTAGTAASVCGTLITYPAAGTPFTNPRIVASIPDAGTVGTFKVLANKGTATATATYYAQMVISPDAIFGY